MIAAVDVQYEEGCGYAACVTFADWTASTATHEYRCRQDSVGEYQPGEFWKRELPCLVAVLALVEPSPEVIVIDGYVWLDGEGRPGLGARLFEAMGGRASVVGVAKTAFRGSEHAARVLRPGSQRPLFVTAQGIPLAEAAEHVGRMAGAYRIPDLLKRADQLARQRL